jgi:outer membrane protein assembly factor BamB
MPGHSGRGVRSGLLPGVLTSQILCLGRAEPSRYTCPRKHPPFHALSQGWEMHREVFMLPARRLRKFLFSALSFCALFSLSASGASDHSTPGWSAKLDGKVSFYQTTELGVLVAATQNSLYAIDGESGETLWRRRNVHLDATDIAPVMGTDLLLLNLEKDKRARLEAVDLLTGKPIWQSEKLKGSVMHMAVDLENELVALVLVRDAKDKPREGFKRRPTVHLLSLATGNESWRRDLNEVEMLPARWSEGEGEDTETVFTLDNYRAPLFLDDRLYLLYDGLTSLDVRTGKERRREGFRVNEDGLALTEADPLWDEQNIYVSGRGRVRAISRSSGKTVWEAQDLGVTSEMMLSNRQLLVRTGGQFTRLKDGEVIKRGPYGVSSINPLSGKILWRYKGADKGITNLAIPDDATVLVADSDELIALDAMTGKPRARIRHKIEGASFVLVNESRQAVVGGQSEIAAFDPTRRTAAGAEQAIWRTRHEAPGRGVLRTIGAIAARAASLYFQYGGVATTTFRGVQLASSLSSLRWSTLASRVVLPSLSDYATASAHQYLASSIRPYGIAMRAQRTRSAVEAIRSPQITIDVDVQERLLDRLDASHQLDRLSRFLWRRQRMAVVRAEHMYFYTELKTENGRGLAGVNLNTGETQRMIRLNEPDPRLVTDEVLGLLYSAEGDRLTAHAFR